MQYEAIKRQNEIEKQEFIQDKYAETLAKIYVNYGKSVYPVANNFAKLLKEASPSKKCD